MTMPVIHIHTGPGAACVLHPESLDDGSNVFTTDPLLWNTLNDACSPGTRLTSDYVNTNRADPDTSALKEERIPDPKRFRDTR